ncbi:MAG: tetratricopeptide repeat protein [Planctomycetota bacterium]
MSISPEVLALEKEAEALKSEDKLAEAIEKYDAALKLDETFVRGHFAIALLYSKTAEYDKSVEHGEKAYSLEKDPINAAFLSQIYQFAFEGTRDTKYIQKAEDANTNL